MEDKIKTNNEPKGLLIFFVILGLIFIGFFSYEDIIYKIKSKNYVKTTAYYYGIDHSYVDSDRKEKYYFKYLYFVDDIGYFYITDYSSKTIPEEDSTMIIKYNPEDPSEYYYKNSSFNDLFICIGIFFVSIPLIMLFYHLIWLKDFIILILSGLILYFIFYNIQDFWNLFISILFFGVFSLAAIIDFIKYYKKNKFDPIGDIKNEIRISKELRQIKKENKQYLSEEEINLKKLKIKKIIKSILMLLLPVFVIIFDIFIGFPNNTISMICILVSCVIMFVGFCTLCIGIESFNDNQVSTITIAGKRIDPEVLSN